MTPDELMARLSGLRRAQIGGKRAPHKPLLLLWLFGQFAATGSARAKTWTGKDCRAAAMSSANGTGQEPVSAPVRRQQQHRRQTGPLDRHGIGAYP